MSTDSSAQLAEVDKAARAAAAGDIPDITRLVARKGANNQGFTVVMFAMAEATRCSEAVRELRSIARKPLYSHEQIKDLHLGFFRAHAKVLENRYALSDTARYLGYVAEALAADRIDDAVTLCYQLTRFLSCLTFLIAVEIPWNELSAAYEGARIVKAALADRLVPLF